VLSAAVSTSRSLRSAFSSGSATHRASLHGAGSRMGTSLHHTVRDRVPIQSPRQRHFHLQPTPTELRKPPASGSPQHSPAPAESVFRSVRAGLDVPGGLVEDPLYSVEDWMHQDRDSLARHTAAIHLLDELWYGFIDLAEEAARSALQVLSPYFIMYFSFSSLLPHHRALPVLVSTHPTSPPPAVTRIHYTKPQIQPKHGSGSYASRWKRSFSDSTSTTIAI
jgi:hypothetical protein